MSKVKCGKCLLSEFDKDFYKETVSEYIETIPKAKKAEQSEYIRRIDICEKCNALMDGLCMECGCFVEIRAVKAWMSCPCGKW